MWNPCSPGLSPVHPEADARAARDFAERCGPDNFRVGVFELSPGRLGVGHRRNPTLSIASTATRGRVIVPSPLNARLAGSAPASGWIPSGGPTRSADAAGADAATRPDGADAGASRVAATSPV